MSIGEKLAKLRSLLPSHGTHGEEMINLIEAVQSDLARLTEENEALRKALEMMYDKWEDGTPCYEGLPDEDGGAIGNAFQLTSEEENLVLSLIPRERSAAIKEGS